MTRKAPPVKAELPAHASSGAISSISTRAPFSRADKAAQVAALPAPTTMTSNSSLPGISIARSYLAVMAGLDPAIHVPDSARRQRGGVDHRVEPGDDD